MATILSLPDQRPGGPASGSASGEVGLKAEVRAFRLELLSQLQVILAEVYEKYGLTSDDEEKRLLRRDMREFTRLHNDLAKSLERSSTDGGQGERSLGLLTESGSQRFIECLENLVQSLIEPVEGIQAALTAEDLDRLREIFTNRFDRSFEPFLKELGEQYEKDERHIVE